MQCCLRIYCSTTIYCSLMYNFVYTFTNWRCTRQQCDKIRDKIFCVRYSYSTHIYYIACGIICYTNSWNFVVRSGYFEGHKVFSAKNSGFWINCIKQSFAILRTHISICCAHTCQMFPLRSCIAFEIVCCTSYRKYSKMKF